MNITFERRDPNTGYPGSSPCRFSFAVTSSDFYSCAAQIAPKISADLAQHRRDQPSPCLLLSAPLRSVSRCRWLFAMLVFRYVFSNRAVAAKLSVCQVKGLHFHSSAFVMVQANMT